MKNIQNNNTIIKKNLSRTTRGSTTSLEIKGKNFNGILCNLELYHLMCYAKTQKITFMEPKSTVSKFYWTPHYRDGNGAGLKDGVFAPTPHGFFLPHSRPAPHDGENFLPHLRPLRPREASPHHVYFLLIFPTTITILSRSLVMDKLYFSNKDNIK